MKSTHLGQDVKSRQTGNVLLVVLIGIVLFAALSYTFSRNTRSAAKISFEDAQLNAQQMISYAEKINGAVQSVSSHNECLASQLSFENTTIAGYANASSPANKKCDIYHASGGGMFYEAPPAAARDTAAATAAGGAWGALVGSYYFTGNVCLDNAGTGADATCSSDGPVVGDNEELLIMAPWITVDVCNAVNQILGNTTLIVDAGTSFNGTKFIGAFADGFTIGDATPAAYQVGCYQSSATSPPGSGYHFYYMLLAR